ncbi:MAG TPA: stage II sporulation protein M, partial [Steroidobacteraceae bacterium]|nr:stage II sporulation protein M [Steroidobacteraceae bacterium]
ATGVDVRWTIAGPGARALAFLIDWGFRAILAVAWYVLGALLYNHDWSFSPPLNPHAGWFIAVVLPAAAIYFLYHPLLETATGGRTPGKRMTGVRIVSRDGGIASFGALLIRNVFRLVDSVPVTYAVGLVTTLATREHVRIGDLAAGTLLVYQPTEDPIATKRAHGSSHELGQRRDDDARAAIALTDEYRSLARQVAQARRLDPDTPPGTRLESAYARLHTALHHPPWNWKQTVVTYLREDIPEVVRWLRPYIIWTSALFLLTALAGYWLVHTHPHLISLFASPDLIATVQRGQLWTEGLLNVVPSSVLSLQILTNNVVVSLFAYCAGFLFGLGTVYVLGLNGLMLGAVFAFTARYGLDDDLFRFMVAHGCVEISVMCLSGAAGAAVGEALIRPAQRSRAAAFQLAALRSGKLILACVILLIGCGLIEGYVSPDPWVPLWLRVTIGVLYWLVMVALLAGWLFPPRRLAVSAA